MDLFYEILYHTLSAILILAEVALFLRALLSWFDPTEESRVASFLYVVTEPIILPVRKLFEKLNWFQDTPFDVAFLAVVLIVAVLRGLMVLF